MNFQGKAKRIDDIDIPRIGSLIRVGEDEIHAFLDTEANGSGFDAKGRPKALYEPHVFWRQLGPGNQRNAAVKRGLAYPKWGTQPYPKDSYPRILEAIKINKEAALRATSWGLTQILGENYELAGYTSAEAMVMDFLDDEEKHLEAAIRFIISKKLDDNLRAHDWKGFAKGYNGVKYYINEYDKKLDKNHRKWKAIRDTPYSPDVVVPIPAPPVPVVKPTPVIVAPEPVTPPKPTFWQVLTQIFKRKKS